MVQQPSSLHDLPLDHQVGLYPTQPPTQLAADLPAELPARSAAPRATGRQVRARKHAIRRVVVVEVAGRLRDVVEDLDRAIQLALADGPRGVVCDLSTVLDGADPVAVEVLATAGRHVRDWPGIPVAVAFPDPLVREALAAHPLGGHLIVTPSLFSAVSAVLATPALAVQWRHLAPHPTAPRASQDRVRSHVRPVKGLAHIHAMSSLSVYRVLVTKTVLVTGGGRGLGRVTAEKLAVAGHRVILVARVAAAAEAAVEEIQHSHPHVRLEARSVDLSSLTQVRAFATTEAERGEPIDLLLNHSSAQRA